MRSVIYIFILLSAFTNAFAISAVLSPSFAISLILVFHFLIYPKQALFITPPYLFFLWLVYSVSFLIMATGEKALNHWFLWTYPFFSYYFVFRSELNWFFTVEEIKAIVLKHITYITLFAAGFGVLEFCCRNFFDTDLRFIPRGSVEEYSPFDLGFYRARSFAEESGHFAFFLEIFGPLSIYWLARNVKLLFQIIGYIIICSSMLATMSGVGILFLGLYIILFFSINERSRKSRVLNRLKNFLVGLCGVMLINAIYPDLLEGLTGIVMSKFDSKNFSRLDRLSRFSALSQLSGFSFLIGYGPAAFSTLGTKTFISLLLGIIMNTGALGLIAFSLFFLSKLRFSRRISDRKLSFALQVSLIFAGLHLLFIDIIYVPWFWILLAIVDVLYVKEKQMLT